MSTFRKPKQALKRSKAGVESSGLLSSSSKGNRKEDQRSASRDAEAKRAREIAKRLASQYPNAETALVYRNPFEMLVATILSAQCTDAKVNEVTPALFDTYPGPEELAAARLEDVETLIRPTGFFRNKAKTLVAMASMLVEEFGGEVPRRMEDLVRLPGVGRKTAAVVQSTALKNEFPEGPEGIAVDTHVFRIAKRLGLSDKNDPDGVERDLTKLLPRSEWGDFALRLILHGRQVCKARKPLCGECVLNDVCPSAGIVG
ncbi:MAG: endonuclease III [Acidimicrobiia bacterium]